MIISCTKKALDKLKKYKNTEDVKVEVGFYNWYLDLVNLNRKNYFLFTHSETLFSFFVYGGTKKELMNIEEIFSENVKEMIVREIGSKASYLEKIIPESSVFGFVKTNSRIVVGSMVDFKNQANCHEDFVLKRDQINHFINKIPMGAIKYQYPKGLMKLNLELHSS